MKKCLSLVISLLLSVNILFGQTQEQLPNPVPPSPNAASLGKFGEIPVGLYTGTPNISVPIYTGKVKNFDLSVSLDYHASGVKVDEYASSVGLGWSLNAGGVISIIRKGGFDEGYQGYRENGAASGKKVQKYLKNEMSSTEKQFFLNACAKGEIDMEPDIFSFNFSGKSGKFVIDTNNNILPFLHQDYKIEKLGENFKITDVNGDQFFFEDRETTSITDFVEQDGTAINPLDPKLYTSSWYLTRIVLNTGDEITYGYTTSTINPVYTGSEAMYYVIPQTQVYDLNGNPIFPDRYIIKSRSETQIVQKKLQSITFPMGKIEFNYSNVQRPDLAGDFALQNIIIYQSYQSVLSKVNKFSLTYIYGGQSSRMYLEKVTEEGADSNLTDNQQVFVYNDIMGVPPVGSMSQDYWGYYNAAVNTTLVPRDYDSFPSFTTGADRDVNPFVLKKGTLEKIIYPTKGYTQFDFEPHQYGAISSMADIADSTYVETNQLAELSNPGLGEMSNQFTIAYQQMVTFNSSLAGWGTSIEVYNNAGGPSQFVYRHTEPGTNDPDFKTLTIMLDPGTYTIRSNNYESTWACYINVNYKQRTFDYIKKYRLAGGLRIKSIKNYDNNGTLLNAKNFKYNMTLEPDRQSGVLVSNYYSEYFKIVYKFNTIGHGADFYSSAIYLMKLSYSCLPLALAQGSHIAYREVTVIDSGVVSNGKTVNKFLSPKEVEDVQFNTFPFGLGQSNDFIRGFLTERTDYAFLNNTYKKLKSVNNKYELFGDALSGLPGLFVGYVIDNIPVPSESTFATNHYLLHTSYRVNLTKTIDTLFDPVNDKFIATEKNIYNENPVHNFITREQTIKSDGSQLISVNTYPQDYASNTPFINDLVSANNVSAPIEQVNYQVKNSQTEVLSGRIIEYHPGGKGLINKVYLLQTNDPLNLSSFKFSNALSGSLPNYNSLGTYSMDGRYYLKSLVNNYDVQGNPLNVKYANGPSTTYLWSYNGQQVIAEIKNMDYASVEGIIGASNINAFRQSNPDKADIDNFLLPLSSSMPSDALLTKFVHNPLIGMASSTDAKGLTTYYEYDNFQRLKCIKDQGGNVIKSYDYHYKP